ncbi:type I restriction endonuclease subunit R [Campylobacter sp. MOP51]|uniref:type I restriction endonuclease subunit R n=1 Tax=Campylobacter canis TaxID=3378588 RepID=UPI003C47E59C
MQENIVEKEVKTQDRVIKLFKNKLGYEYLGDLQSLDNKNIREDDLKSWLQSRGYTDTLIEKALKKLNDENHTSGGRKLYDANEAIYSLLRYGVKVKEGAGETNQTVWLIDWDNPLANKFSIAEEVSVKTANGEFSKRPDIVLYINGIAVCVLELKRSSVSVSEGIRQNLSSQDKRFIESFFTTVQLVMAGNESEGLRYGVIETPEKYFLEFKENREKLSLYDGLIAICECKRLVEILHDFIIYDAGIKKTCRHNQYFGVKSAQNFLYAKKGGIIWHTQGSGKSLSMVWLAKWIKENLNSRVLIITDRTELDEQIEKVFNGVKENIYRTKSGADLLEKLSSSEHSLVCSLVHKFGRNGAEDESDDSAMSAYLEDIKRRAGNFRVNGDVVVFVDECHRTQSGKLHEAMKMLMPDAIFIGFTGTPLLKNDKKSSMQVFGEFIHTYKFDEAVRDGVVLDLVYEARDIEQWLGSKDKLDKEFENKTRGLSDLAKGEVKARWATLQKLMSSRQRLDKIVGDILFDMENKTRLKERGNAIFVCSSVYEACEAYKIFSDNGFEKKCAIITSYRPTASAIKNEITGDGMSDGEYKYKIYKQMIASYYDINIKDVDDARADQFELDAKKEFREKPEKMKLLIVVDKLLTGFDAPSATYLYIDKPMRDHGLFQAICRVNRLDGESKEYGYIVDYRDLFKSLEKAYKNYTKEAFDGYDESDIAGLLKDRLEKGKEDLENAWESLSAICDGVKSPKSNREFIEYFCLNDKENLNNEMQARRLSFYRAVAVFVRAYSQVANELLKLEYTKEQELEWDNRVKNFSMLRDAVKLASGDYVDMRKWDNDMRILINRYVNAGESKVLAEFEDKGLLEILVQNESIGEEEIKALGGNEGVAEAIENNIRRIIVDDNQLNPKFYENLSQILDELIEQRKKGALEYEKYLKEVINLAKQLKTKDIDKAYPLEINSAGKRAIYDNFNQDVDWVERLDKAIKMHKPDGYIGNTMKERSLKNAIKQLSDEKSVNLDKLFELIKLQEDYQ